MKRLLFLAAVLVALSITAVGCEEDTIDPNVLVGLADFVASPDSLVFTDEPGTSTFFLSSPGPGRVTWRVASGPYWATVTPREGILEDDIVNVSVTGSPNRLPPGISTGRVQLISSAGAASVVLRFEVAVRRLLEVSENTIVIDENATEASIELTNPGNTPSPWALADLPSWLEAEPPAGTVEPGETRTVVFRADRRGLPEGRLEADLTLNTEADGGDRTIAATLDVASAGLLAVNTTAIRIDFESEATTVEIENVGNQALDWNASVGDAFLGVEPSNGSLEPGATTDVTVRVDRATLGNGRTTSGVTFNYGDAGLVRATVEVDHVVQVLDMLDVTVVDAEYDRVNDRIAIAASDGDGLLIVDAETGDRRAVPLELPARCVSIAPDGFTAAVGHDAYFSLVDLGAGAVLRIYPVTTDAIDIVLAPNGHCYVFPRTDQWETVRCVSLADGNETTNTGGFIRAGTLARLHPSGDFIYGADNGVSPSDFEKYDIRNGTAESMYDSPYHGDYAFSGNVWISDDGARLFARSSNVFRASTDRAVDMTYNGNLAGVNYLQWVEHSSVAGRVVAFARATFSSDPEPGLHVYDDAFLALRGTESLPPFYVPDGSSGIREVEARGQFAFFDAAGSTVHVIVKADEGSGLLKDWAMTSIPTSDLP